MTISPIFILECTLLCLGAGLIYGLFGGGSGLLMTPGFYYLLRHFDATQTHRMQTAIATTAIASSLIGVIAAYTQWKSKNIDSFALKRMIPGLTIGTVLAVVSLNLIPSQFLKQLFGVVVILVAIWMWLYKPEKDTANWSLKNSLNHLCTLFIGLLWFMLGVAVFNVPYMHKCHIDIRKAVGTASLLGCVFSALAGFLFMFSGSFTVGVSASHIGYVNLVLLAIAVIPSMLAGYIGTRLSHRLPRQLLKKSYAGLIFIVGGLMLV